MFFNKKRFDRNSFRLDLPDFEKIELPEMIKLGKTEISKKGKIKVPKFEKPKLKLDIKPKRKGSFLNLKKLDKSSREDLVDFKLRLKEYENGIKIVSNRIKEHDDSISGLKKTVNNFSEDLKNLRNTRLDISTFNSFSRQIKNRLDSLDKLDKEVSKKIDLIKDLKRRIDEKYSLNLKITNQMQERMMDLRKENSNEVIQENLSKIMIFVKELADAFNNSVGVREEIKKKLIEHDTRIRELIDFVQRPSDVEEYLRKNSE